MTGANEGAHGDGNDGEGPALATDARRSDNKNSDVQGDLARRGWRASIGNKGEEEGEGGKGDGNGNGNGDGDVGCVEEGDGRVAREVATATRVAGGKEGNEDEEGNDDGDVGGG